MSISLSEKFRAVMAANDNPAGLQAIMATPGFTDIFSDSVIPVDPHEPAPHGIPRFLLPFSRFQTEEDQRRIALLAQKIADGGTQLVVDFDGTVSQFAQTANEAHIDPGCFQGLTRLQDAGVPVVFLTGREPENLRDKLLAPERVTLDAFGRVTARAPFDGVHDNSGRTVLPANNDRLRFPIIGSHGAVSQRADAADGTPAPVEKIKISAAERACMEKSYAIGRALAAKYPDLRIHNKDDNGVNIHASDVPAAQQAGAIAEARAALMALVSGADNPVIDGRPAFIVANESAIETCLRNERLNKAFALSGHGLIDTAKPLLFLCDSLSPTGTDYEAAARVNREFEHGLVGHVLNGRAESYPTPGEPQTPFATFASPAQLGRFLTFAADLRERQLGLHLRAGNNITPTPGPA